MTTIITLTEDIPAELKATLQAAFKDKPDNNVLDKLREYADVYPDILARFFDITNIVRGQLIDKIAGKPNASIALQAKVLVMKNDLGYDQAPVIERMLIDNILNTWLRLNWVEYTLAGYMGTGSVSYELIRYWERRLTESQNRHLRAIESLARVRRMQLPMLQVNIASDGGQQVNVAGDINQKGE